MDSLQHDAQEVDLNLFEYLLIFWRRKWEMLLTINCVIILTVVYTFWGTGNVYEAKTTIMPLKSSSNPLSAPGNMVPAGFMPFQIGRTDSDLYRFVNILQSRMAAEAVVHHLDLANQLYPDASPEERPAFQQVVATVKDNLIRASYDAQGLLKLTGRAQSPHLAADIANASIEYLRAYLKENTTTESRRNLRFVEEQYQKALEDLGDAERDLQIFQEQHRLFSISEQTNYIVTLVGNLKGNRMAKEAELNVLTRLGISENNPQYKTLLFEIDELRQQIDELETGAGGSSQASPVVLEALPELQRELAELMRETTIQATLASLLAQQLKQAEIEDERDQVTFLKLDAAIPPLRPISPNRKLNLLLGGVLGVMLAVAYVILREVVGKYRSQFQAE